MQSRLKLGFPLAAVLLMTACGGDSSGSTVDAVEDEDSAAAENPQADNLASLFADSAEWVIAPVANSETCFDFEQNAEIACSGSDWDLKMVMGSRTPSFFTNSGESGEGSGGTLGSPFAYSWEDLQAFTSGLSDADGNALNSRAYLSDSLDNAFANSSNAIGSAVFEYTSSHKLLSNYSVFLLTTDSSNAYDAADANVFAVQITGYYGGDTGATSGYPSLRWVNVGELTADPDTAVVNSATLDATAGWVYFNLSTAATVADPENNTWHLAFNRYNVKTNSGISGAGSVGTFHAQQPDGFYDADGNAIESAFSDSSAIATAEAALTDTSDWTAWSARTSWAEDAAYSVLNPDYQGTYPGVLNYGFYSYDPTGTTAGAEHMLLANSDNAVMLRSGSGTAYARMHLINLQYADSADSSSQTTWTFAFEVQPTAE